jgi:DNA ligase-1
MGFKPNLAGNVTKPDLLKFPLWASEKIDGVRATVINGKFVSRTGKPIPNLYTQSIVQAHWEGLDGELVSGPDNAPDVFNKTQSAVMTIKGEPHVMFKLFDMINIDAPYYQRYEIVKEFIGPAYYIEQHIIRGIKELDVFEADCLGAGYEGVMLRDPDAKYKQGRSTEREGGLLKLKRFIDNEAVVVECVRGFGKYENTLGALRVMNDDMIIFCVGSGLTDNDRFEIWANPDAVIGKYITYKSFPVGVKDLPRFPIFKGFRDVIDF